LAVLVPLLLAATGTAAVLPPYQQVLHPRLDPAGPADAVVVLGPATVDGALDRGRQLASEDPGAVLAVSSDPRQRGYLRFLCRTASSGTAPAPLCFVPDPLTTQGEARAVRQLAADHHWTRIVVVTPTYHVTRARLLFTRCLAGTGTRVAVTDSGTTAGTRKLLFEFVYQSAALAKARLSDRC
jgi:uncharacterized SAM-binding protein YcdF (DUF218 family)